MADGRCRLMCRPSIYVIRSRQITWEFLDEFGNWCSLCSLVDGMAFRVILFVGFDGQKPSRVSL